ncbi:hypothetical protein HOB10_00225 [Candidatus Parcubacteria bacterium]|nr:hypothetical protein [Candidatus Parcubacteria bacterium]
MPSLASAQADLYGVNRMTETNLGTREIGDTASSIVNIVLGFLGILATLGILAGGFVYMTSGGNADKKGQGQNGMIAGVIGLVIVLAAYAISRFVLTSLQNETTY